MEGKIYNLAGHRGQTATTTHAQQGRGTRVLCIPPLVSTNQVRLLTRQARKNYCDQMGVRSDGAVIAPNSMMRPWKPVRPSQQARPSAHHTSRARALLRDESLRVLPYRLQPPETPQQDSTDRFQLKMIPIQRSQMNYTITYRTDQRPLNKPKIRRAVIAPNSRAPVCSSSSNSPASAQHKR